MKEENQTIIKAINMFGRVPEQYELLEEIEKLNKESKILRENAEHNDKVVDKVNWENKRLNNIINEALGIANERFNYYSNHKNNNQEHLEDWGNIFNILLRRDDK